MISPSKAVVRVPRQWARLARYVVGAGFPESSVVPPAPEVCVGSGRRWHAWSL